MSRFSSSSQIGTTDVRVGRIVDIDSNRYSATVYLTDNTGTLLDVPWKTPYGASTRGAGIIYQPALNSLCCVRMNSRGGMSDPIIESFLPQIGNKPRFNAQLLHEVGEGGKHSKTNFGSVSFDSGRPKDLLPGDQMFLGPNGEVVGIGVGGLAYIKVSELCQILAFQQDDLLKIIARNQRNYSDMGESSVQNTDGEIFSHEFMANTEAEGRHEKFRVRLLKMKSSGVRPSSNGAGDPPTIENLLFLQINQIKSEGGVPDKEIPVGEVCIGVDGGLQVRSSVEIKSEIIKSTIEGFSALVGGLGQGKVSPVTSTHGGNKTKDQDLYDRKGAEIHSVIHQTASGEIHIQDTDESSIDMQKGNIHIQCKGTYKVVCKDFVVRSTNVDWNNKQHVNWAMGLNTKFNGKAMTHEFDVDLTKAASIQHNQ